MTQDVDRERLDPFRLVECEVVGGDGPLDRLAQHLAHHALVDGGAPRAGNRLQGGGQVGAVDAVARPGDPAPRVHVSSRGLSAELGLPAPETQGQLLAGREPLPSETDRRPQHPAQIEAAEAPVESQPPVHAAGNRDGSRVSLRDLLDIGSPQFVGEPGRARPGAPGGVERHHLCRAVTGDQGKQVAADAAGLGCHHTLDGVDGDGGVDGIAALAQHGDAGGGGEVMGRGHHGVVTVDGARKKGYLGGHRVSGGGRA